VKIFINSYSCIAGSIAEVFYSGVPDEIWEKVFLDEELLGVVEKWEGTISR